MKESSPVLSAAEVDGYLREVFPQVYADGDLVTIESIGPMTARLRLAVSEQHLRPGGTVSGPTMFMAADLALYVAILGQIGQQALAVTTNISINFLRKPAPGDLFAECRLLKLGSRLAVGEVFLTSGVEEAPVAQATGTYSIPPLR